MKTMVRKLRSPFKWHGGKSYLARRIIGLFPEHGSYIEPFAGGLSVLLNKPTSGNEFANDLNGDLVDTWRDIRDVGKLIQEELSSLAYHEDTFKNISETTPYPSVDFIVRNRMSRGGLGKDFAWPDRLRGGKPGDVNAWETFVRDDFLGVSRRIRDVAFTKLDATIHIDRSLVQHTFRSGPNSKALIYADPPYMHETRTHTKTYAHEMSKDDHHDLISCLKRADERGAKVFLSGYDNPSYREWIPRDWTRHGFDMPNHSGQGATKQRQIECLWESPA